MTPAPSWSHHTTLSPSAYADYLRWRNGGEVAISAPTHLSEAQLHRLDALARLVVQTFEREGKHPSGFSWLGCSIANRLCDSWSVYSRAEWKSPPTWLVWCFKARGAETHLVVPAAPVHSTPESTRAACGVIARLARCEELAGAIETWVMTGAVPGA